ncbi:polynucleotide kinase-phosphatase [Oscillospiraceae bacterium OttesenSCG-928-F05]|nr:polynucleotide kinase-phosphatase [Oscillospiraceae bacterium OttesenSCG-928-F05]
MRIEIPELCVVALVGASGSGKSTFAGKYFKPTEVLSSDFFRGLISDDENDQSATSAAFESLYYIANKRLNSGRLVVIDATNVQKGARESVVKLAKGQNCFPVAIVFDFPEELCQERNRKRPDRDFGPHVVRNQTRDLKRSIRNLKKEGFRYIYVLKSPEEADEVEIVRTRLWTNRREERGPFDIIGDVHGCFDELCALLHKLGYSVCAESYTASHPEGRRVIFLGDFCDRGPKNIEVLRLAMNMCESGSALAVPGNHDVKLLKYLRGANVQLTHGLDITVMQLGKEPEEFTEKVKAFLDGLISHAVLDDGKLAVAHAGIKERFQGRSSGRVRDFCLYGETTGETDEFGLPVRLPWAEEYRGRARVVYGHTPSLEVQSVNNTYCIDTGCVFGGKLTAYRYPENEAVQVSALTQYYEPIKPLAPAEEPRGDLLDIRDVQGKRHITARLHKRPITVREDSSIAALEIMSRFAADPRWLIYLPPTMSPCETSKLDGFLEHPLEAFDYYKKNGIQQVVCEQKHMGSRAVIVLCRNAETAQSRFGINDGTVGLIYTRTGRHFFDDGETEQALLARLCGALDASGFWKDFDTDWVCLDTELMPWSAKARKLLIEQYAPVGRAGRDGLGNAVSALERAAALQTGGFEVDAMTSGRNVDLGCLLDEYKAKHTALEKYTDAYRQYCWTVSSLGDYRIAPFHILATEGKVWSNDTHITHMDTIRKYMTGSDPVFMATNHVVVDLSDDVSVQTGVEWWMELTGSGGEGMVVKSIDFTVFSEGKNELLQPAVKCRGPEYLRIIYGPEYTLGGHLERLKKRSLAKKRRLALAEFSLGMESLERFVKKTPLYRVHECVFAVLAMESEPVDPRL